MEKSKYKDIIKTSLDLMVFFQEIISNEKIKDGVYVVYVANPDEYANTENHSAVIYIKNEKLIYFNSSVAEHIPKEAKKL